MKITMLNGPGFPPHMRDFHLRAADWDRRALDYLLHYDKTDIQRPDYRIDRGMAEVMGNSLVAFDVFEHLRNLHKQLGEPVEVIEGGCGLGNSLVDLKRGITFAELPGNETPLIELPFHTYRWRNGLAGRRFEGLAGKIRTTGVTLSLDHANIAKMAEEPYRIDEMAIGPLNMCRTGRNYDFFLDFYGAGFYSFDDALPAYAALLKPGGFGLFRTNDLIKGDMTTKRNFIREVGFDIIDENGTFYSTDMVLKRR